MAVDERGARMLVAQELVGLAVAVADPRHVAGKRVGVGVPRVEVLRERCAVASDAGAEFLQRGKVFDDLVELGGGERVAIGEAREDDVLRTQLQEDAVQLLVVVDVLLPLLALDLIEGRLGDVDVAALDEPLHLAVEEGEQQRADVGAVDVGVGHDDDAVVAQLRNVEAAVRIFHAGVLNARAERHDQLDSEP